jgi:hypothetical protein
LYQITALGSEEVADIITFPSLFMDTNKAYRQCANPSQEFFYGLVTDVSKQDKHVKVCFELIPSSPKYQQRLNDIAASVGINTNNGKDALDETGWLIKKINIRQVLTSAGIGYT